MSSVVADLKFAVRLMTRGPGLTVILVLTLALGIATTTAIFSVVNSVLLKPLPYKDPDQLHRVYTEFLGKMQLKKFWVSGPELWDLQQGCKRTCESVGGLMHGTASFSGGDRPVRVRAAYATHTLLPLLGVQPLMGRYFDASEDTPGDPRVVVIGYNVWQRAFGGDPDIVGKVVHADAMPVTVVGVMPQGFDFIGGEEAWFPTTLDINDQNRRGGHNFDVFVRLKPGMTGADFQEEIKSLIHAWSDGRKKGDAGPHYIGPEGHPMITVPLHDDITGSMSTALWLLQAAALFVLLISIVNVANLLLARSETRNREIAVRHALGARRRRLVRQFLTESVALGVLGGGLGILLAVWAVDGIVALIPKSAPRVSEIGLDATAVIFAVACSLVASLLFGLAPILHARKADIHSSLKDGGPRMTGSKARLRVRRGLVIAEVALALVLVVGCGVMVKSFMRLQSVDLGFKPDHLLTAEIELPPKNYPDGATVYPFFQRLQDRASALPGVVSATVIGGLPPQRRLNANDINFPGRENDNATTPWNVDYWQIIGDRTIETMGMRLVRGRAIGPGDTAGAPGVVMVNEAFAKKFWPGQDPIGQLVNIDGGPPEPGKEQRVVGVIADVKQMGVDRPAGTEVIFTAWQSEALAGFAPNTMNVVLRTKGDPMDLAPALQKAVASLDPTLPVSKLRSMDDVLWEAVARPRFLMFLLTAFAGMALLLAAIGIYGVMAHTVEQRTHEIGVRLALGAQPGQVRRMVLRQAAILAAIGVGIGIVGAVALQAGLGPSLRGVLYGEALGQPLMLAGVGAVVMIAALVATWIPARRATRVEPMVALRAE
jgi:putative ABC transport system permease protein